MSSVRPSGRRVGRVGAHRASNPRDHHAAPPDGRIPGRVRARDVSAPRTPPNRTCPSDHRADDVDARRERSRRGRRARPSRVRNRVRARAGESGPGRARSWSHYPRCDPWRTANRTAMSHHRPRSAGMNTCSTASPTDFSTPPLSVGSRASARPCARASGTGNRSYPAVCPV